MFRQVPDTDTLFVKFMYSYLLIYLSARLYMHLTLIYQLTNLFPYHRSSYVPIYRLRRGFIHVFKLHDAYHLN